MRVNERTRYGALYWKQTEVAAVQPEDSYRFINMDKFLGALREGGIEVFEARGRAFPPGVRMHDRAAIVPNIILSPRSEKDVIYITKLLKSMDIYKESAVSVMSGGHGYHNGASCDGIMISTSLMTQRNIAENTLIVEPGCLLGHLITTLQAHEKAVPHGDCFGVAAGGHFLTAGWDIALARRYGLGCQSVIGGRIVLWDGSVLDVDETNFPDLLHAMRGGAAAGVGLVTQIRLELAPQPPTVSWCFKSLSPDQLQICATQKAFENAKSLPVDISVSFRFHFEPHQLDPICSLNVVSLMSPQDTLDMLYYFLGSHVASVLGEITGWCSGSLLDLRLVPASDALARFPKALEHVTHEALHQDPLQFWKPTVSAREMASSYFTSISHWLVPSCDSMLLRLYENFQAVRQSPARERMYALIIQGGGRMKELQQQCSMPLGEALARFELHWDDEKDEKWSRAFTDTISKVMEPLVDRNPERPYRGDIWFNEQGNDPVLDGILETYDRRTS